MTAELIGQIMAALFLISWPILAVTAFTLWQMNTKLKRDLAKPRYVYRGYSSYEPSIHVLLAETMAIQSRLEKENDILKRTLARVSRDQMAEVNAQDEGFDWDAVHFQDLQEQRRCGYAWRLPTGKFVRCIREIPHTGGHISANNDHAPEE
jgi:hypothetical protein